MISEKNNKIINKIIDEMILEIEKLFDDKENLSANMKIIKELTMVLKELEKLYDNEQDLINKNNEKNRDKFLESLFESARCEPHGASRTGDK